MDNYKRLKKVNRDSIKSIKQYFLDVIDNELLENKKVANKYKENCIVYLAENFSQLPPSLFYVFRFIAEDYLNKQGEE